jgi:uncharacterized OB-fold protein
MERNILGYKCKKCGYVHYPYHTRCVKCGHVEVRKGNIEFDTVPLPKTGKLLTYTHLFALPPDFEVVNLTFGIVELEDGHRVTGHLRCDAPKSGMKVRAEIEVVRREEYKRHFGLVFYPA